MNKYTFFWLTGNRDILEGNTPEEALSNAGYSAGALRALDFYTHGENDKYIYEDGKWHICKDCFLDEEITHWMPLPKKPKE